MNRRILLQAFLMTVVIPGIVYGILSRWKEPQMNMVTTDTTGPELVSVTVLSEENILSMDLEEYVECVVLGEIPSDFETETLKAQAVASRTYTLDRVCQNGKHGRAFLCTDAGCCQAYCSAEAFLVKGGSQDYIDRVRDAVMQTAGEVLLYDGKLIEATYFSASGGRTEAAVEVWGTDIPYLQSVESKGEQAQQYDRRILQFEQETFLEKLGLPAEYTGKMTCTDIKYTDGNGIASITVAGKEFTGRQIREFLGLPSTVFEISITEDYVTIITDGNGHRVGMSQYGADAMAAAGKNYIQILDHYYPGSYLQQLTWDEIKAVFDKAGNL